MVKQLLLFHKQKLRRRISLLKRKDVCLRILRLYIVRNCMNWNFISVPSVIRCTLRFFLFFLFRGDSSSPRYVKKNSQELSFIIKLRHRFSLIRKLIKRFCNYACYPISQVFKRTDLRFSRNKEIRILLWGMDLNETLYHIAHPLRCLVLLSLFFFSFSFAEVRQFLVVKKTARTVITFRQERIVSKCSWTSLDYNGHLGDRRKWPLQRGDRCREFETRFSVWTFRQEKKWPL